MVIRGMCADDISALTDLLALAFRDNPLNRAAIAGGPRRRLRSNRAGMRLNLEAARVSGEVWVAHADDGLPVGGLVAVPPQAWPMPPPPLFDQLKLLFVQGFSTLQRWGDVYQILQSSHPQEPHWYLWLLGVEPNKKRAGIGTALLEKWLERVDDDGAPAYLETDRRENLGFYQKAGFDIVDEDRILATRFWRMWRPASV